MSILQRWSGSVKSITEDRGEFVRSVYRTLAREQLAKLSGKHARRRAKRVLGKGWEVEVVSLFLPEIGDTMILLEADRTVLAFKLEELCEEYACCLDVMEA
jgi:hypothetical protein